MVSGALTGHPETEWERAGEGTPVCKQGRKFREQVLSDAVSSSVKWVGGAD